MPPQPHCGHTLCGQNVGPHAAPATLCGQNVGPMPPPPHCGHTSSNTTVCAMSVSINTELLAICCWFDTPAHNCVTPPVSDCCLAKGIPFRYPSQPNSEQPPSRPHIRGFMDHLRRSCLRHEPGHSPSSAEISPPAPQWVFIRTSAHFSNSDMSGYTWIRQKVGNFLAS